MTARTRDHGPVTSAPASQAVTVAITRRTEAGREPEMAAWVRTGQVYERLALQMTALGVQSAFLNQPIEVGHVRSQLGSAMRLGTALPQLLMRFGHAPAMPLSLRRPVSQVLTTL